MELASKIQPQLIKTKQRELDFIANEALLKVGSEYRWLWIAIKPENKQVLSLFW
jgi:putative transposase